MKVFLSWSGERSKLIAEILRGWLPLVIQAVKPWLSASDIDKGTRWSSDIATQLEETSFGIICLTPENLDAPWIQFEAGALSKTIDGAFVCPYLFEVDPADIKGPLVQFQTTRATKEDTKNLVNTINSLLQECIPEIQLNKVFEMWWPDFEEKLTAVNHIVKERTQIKRSDRELLEEILDTLRSQTRDKELSRQLPLFDEFESETVAIDHNPDWQIGMKVIHPKFGSGVVRKVEGNGRDTKVIVWFDTVGPKKLLVRFANLEIQQ
ncbi:MAG: TIR domain-containing protein [Desulfuromonadales bacterium]|nr:TIR domain-containing protein [Desulfuromonadales bacterium]